MKEPPSLAQVVTNIGTFTVDWISWISSVYLICRSSTESGTTAQRPTKNLWVGRRYFDKTLGIPIFYNGTAWVNASGTTV